MSAILPSFLLAIIVVLLAAVFRNRPDPKHLFILKLLIWAQDEEASRELKI
jgi:hypothetical protein